MLEQLYALINERYEAGRALIVTTNNDEAELEEQIGARVVSRLVEMCEAVPLFGDDQPLERDARATGSARPAARARSTLGPLDRWAPLPP